MLFPPFFLVSQVNNQSHLFEPAISSLSQTYLQAGHMEMPRALRPFE